MFPEALVRRWQLTRHASFWTHGCDQLQMAADGQCDEDHKRAADWKQYLVEHGRQQLRVCQRDVFSAREFQREPGRAAAEHQPHCRPYPEKAMRARLISRDHRSQRPAENAVFERTYDAKLGQ